MEQKMRFGLVLGQLAILKNKLGADYEQFLRVVFSCFQGQKKYPTVCFVIFSFFSYKPTVYKTGPTIISTRATLKFNGRLSVISRFY